MGILKAIQDRRSIRQYEDRPVDDRQIRTLLEAARLAPSGSNMQPWHFMVVRSPEAKKRIVEACHNQPWMRRAPILIVAVADPGSPFAGPAGPTVHETSPDRDVKRAIRDTAIATEHLVLQAIDLGLSTCWVAWFEQDRIRPGLGIPEDKYVVAVIVLGYGRETPPPRPRKPLTEFVHLETWGRTGQL